MAIAHNSSGEIGAKSLAIVELPEFTVVKTPQISEQSVLGSSTKRSSCRCLIIALICVGILLALVTIVLTILYTGGWFYCTAGSADGMRTQSVIQQTPFSFEDIFNQSYIPRGYSSDFVGEGSKMVYRDDSGSLIEYDPSTGEKQVIMDNSTFLSLNTGTYYVSWDLQFVLLAYEQQYIWRHSYNAKYKIYERSTGYLYNFPNHDTLQNQTLQLCRFAARTNQLAFVYNNNLYYQASAMVSAVQLTTDGDKYYIYNGIADYLYEEDVFGATKTHYFSVGGHYLLYAKLNDTGVPLMSVVMYGDKTNMYPRVIEYPYPKPGDLRDGKLGPNTKVTLHIVDLTELQSPHWQVLPPVELEGEDYYYTGVTWRDDDSVLIFWSNRIQNKSIAMFCSAVEQSCVKNHELEVSGGWVPSSRVCKFVEDGKSYVTILPHYLGEQGTWLHLAQVTVSSEGSGDVSFLTNGTQEVRSVVGYDNSTSTVYYLDTNGEPTERHLFKVGTKTSQQISQCMTCDVGPGCLYVSAEFSSNGKYYIRKCLGPDIPSYTLIGIDDGLDIVLENNSDVRESLSQKLLPRREFFDIDISNGYKGKAEVFFPPSYVPGNTTHKYLQNVYAGPDSKEVTKAFPIGGGTSSWLTFLGSSHDVIVTSVDGRGTHSNGEEYKFLMYKRLGRVEIEDQIAGANHFKSEPFVDPTKGAAIFGWSYGGFSAAQSVAWDNETFLCAIAVAPVTNYHYYDTAYTERYLGFANENYAGYNDSDISNKAEMFKNKLFMMNHGTADDNVQLQHFMQLSKALIEKGVHFREQLYVDQNHGIPYSTRHLYTGFTDFLLNDCWQEK